MKLENYAVTVIMETLGKVIQVEQCDQEVQTIQKLFLSKLETSGFNGWTVQRVKSWLAGWVQRVVVNASVLRWRLVMSDVPQALFWDHCSAVFTSMTQTVGLSAISASLQMTQI